MALLGFRMAAMAMMTSTTIWSLCFFTTWVVAAFVSTRARTMLVATVVSTAAVGIERAFRIACRWVVIFKMAVVYILIMRNGNVPSKACRGSRSRLAVVLITADGRMGPRIVVAEARVVGHGVKMLVHAVNQLLKRALLDQNKD